MARYRYLLLAVLLILVAGLTKAPAHAEDQGPTVPRPLEVPTHILEPWTILSEEVWNTADFPVSETFTPRIVGGTPVLPENRYPWMGSLQYYGVHYCGATLIHADWAITAAHCWMDEYGNQYSLTPNDKLVFGEYSRNFVSGNEQEIGISEVIIHPNFAYSTLSNDVALMHLAESPMVTAYVQPGTLVDLNYSTDGKPFGPAEITGWGDTSFGGSSSDILLMANVDVLADSYCANYGAAFDAVSMLCAGVYEGGTDSCQGDSGGPLMVQDADVSWFIGGITSWGNECAKPGFPGIYSNLSSPVIMDWVRGTLNEGTTTIGIYDPVNSYYYMRSANTDTPSEPDLAVGYGVAGGGWIPLAGDWDGDGDDTVGIYDPYNSLFYLRNSNSSGVSDFGMWFGVPNGGWIPLVGDWDGDGKDSFGIYDPVYSYFYLSNSTTEPTVDFAVGYGVPGGGWIPLVGDWDGDGDDTIGIYDPEHSLFYLRNTNVSGVSDYGLWFGVPNGGWIPLAGDWNGDGVDTIGIYDPVNSYFFLKESNFSGITDYSLSYGPPNQGWIPLAADWDGE